MFWHESWGQCAYGAYKRDAHTREDLEKVVDKHALRDLSLEQMIGSSWQFTDRALAHGLDTPANSVLSPIKLHQHGFHGCMDTEDSFVYWIERMQKTRLLPQ